MQLVTNREQYSDDQPVAYQVVNRKTTPIYFADYSYGIQAYTYDQQSQKWKLFPWEFDLIDPKPVVAAPGTGKGLENSYVIGIESMPRSGKVRLAIVGWLDPKNPEGSKIAAYADIEIVQ
ncbi:MAG: hypothetical protein KGJ80_19965 [Chloroflexota bacterium]|nr:hypothetical protein [Chloroflexota bacterium]